MAPSSSPQQLPQGHGISPRPYARACGLTSKSELLKLLIERDLPAFDLPYSAAQRAQLAQLGEAIWQGARKDLLASNNAGKWTFAFRPTHVAAERAAVDAVILDAMGAPAGAALALTAFEQRVVSVDGSDRRAKAGEYEKLIMRGLAK